MEYISGLQKAEKHENRCALVGMYHACCNIHVVLIVFPLSTWVHTSLCNGRLPASYYAPFDLSTLMKLLEVPQRLSTSQDSRSLTGAKAFSSKVQSSRWSSADAVADAVYLEGGMVGDNV